MMEPEKKPIDWPKEFVRSMIRSQKNKCDHLDLFICPYTHHPDPSVCINCLSYFVKRITASQSEADQHSVATIEEKPKIAYICDRRACETCSYPNCIHTFDISHAADFTKDGAGNFIEE